MAISDVRYELEAGPHATTDLLVYQLEAEEDEQDRPEAEKRRPDARLES